MTLRAAVALLPVARSTKGNGAACEQRITVQAARALLQAAHYEAVAMRRGQDALAADLPLVEALLAEGTVH